MIKNLFPTILKQLFALSSSLMFIKLKKFNTDFNFFFQKYKTKFYFFGSENIIFKFKNIQMIF